MKKKVIRLTESDLERLVRKIIKEDEGFDWVRDITNNNIIIDLSDRLYSLQEIERLGSIINREFNLNWNPEYIYREQLEEDGDFIGDYDVDYAFGLALEYSHKTEKFHMYGTDPNEEEYLGYDRFNYDDFILRYEH